jgi:autotransporter-associated beta strand protein
VSAGLAGTSATVGLSKSTSGTVILSGTNTLAGTITDSAGRLVLDYSGGATILPSADAIALAGGTLEVMSGSSPAPVTLGAVSTTANTGMSTLAVDANTAVTAQSLTRNSGSALFLDLSGAGSSLSFTTGPVVTNGVITAGGGNAAVTMEDSNGRYDFAALGAGNSIQRLNATTALVATGGTSGTNYLLTANTTPFSLTGNVAASTLRIDTTGAGGTLDLAGKTLTLGLFGVLNDGSNDFTIANSGTGGGLVGTSAVFVYQFGTGKLTLGATINSPQAFFMGNGLIDWTSASGGNSATHVYGATLRLSGAGITLDNSVTSGNGTGVLNIGNNGILELNTGPFLRAVGGSANQVHFIADGGGFSAYGADRVVNLGGAGATLKFGSTSGFLASGNKLILGSPYANATVDFQNGLDLNGATQTIEVQSPNVTGFGGMVSGNIVGAGGNLAKTGQGILNLAGANTYTGTTAVNAGTMLVTGSINGTSAVTVASGAELKLSGTGNIAAGTLSLSDSSKLSLEVGTLTTAPISLTGNTSLSGDITLALTLTTAPADGTVYTLIDGSSPLEGYDDGARFMADGTVLDDGSFFTVNTGDLSERFQISYQGGADGNDVTVQAIQNVPEPSTGAVLLASLGMLIGVNRFRRRSLRR